MPLSTLERRHSLVPAGEFAGQARSGRGPKGRREPKMLDTGARSVEEVLGGTGTDATGLVDAHLAGSGASQHGTAGSLPLHRG